MTPKDLTSIAVPELLRAYADAAAEHGEGILMFNHRRANPSADTVASIYRELRRRGPVAQGALLALLDHPHRGVRGWAAAHALEFSAAEGERVLRRLAGFPDILGLQSKTVLTEWERGALTFP